MLIEPIKLYASFFGGLLKSNVPQSQKGNLNDH